MALTLGLALAINYACYRSLTSFKESKAKNLELHQIDFGHYLKQLDLL